MADNDMSQPTICRRCGLKMTKETRLSFNPNVCQCAIYGPDELEERFKQRQVPPHCPSGPLGGIQGVRAAYDAASRHHDKVAAQWTVSRQARRWTRADMAYIVGAIVVIGLLVYLLLWKTE